MRLVLLACAAALLAGCGYVGDPLPPALNIPVAVTDLRAMQRGDKLILEFTAPSLTTDDVGLTTISSAEVRIGDDAVPVPAPKPGTPAHVELPSRQWTGRQAAIRVILTGPKGQRSNESNAITLRIAEPLSVPSNVKAEPHPEGMRVTWSAPPAQTARYQVRRDPSAVAVVDGPEYIDRTVEMGKEYKYTVTAIAGDVESLPSATVAEVARDTFAPAPPANLNAIAGVNSIELNWDPSPAADLKGYSVYRNDVAIAQDVQAPSFSDKQAMAGQRYRYAVCAVDRTGNESPKSTAVEMVAP